MPYKNKKDRKKADRRYYIKNREKILEHKRRYHIKNSKKRLEKAKQYRIENREKIKHYRVKNRKEINKHYIQKYKTDTKYNLNDKISSIVYQSLKGNKAGRKWESLTGYNLISLIKRLKETMPVGYTWKDVLLGELHIDHIIPIVAFNFTRPEHTDFKRCWALSNLRLLPAKENLIKHNYLDRPFQPALRI